MKFFKKESAFTLAEVLITLMIIGTISAITIPSLKKHASQEEYISRAKKAYSAISQATKLIETQHGEIKRWGPLTGAVSDSEDPAENDENKAAPNGVTKAHKYYGERLNIVKNCTNGGAGCWTQTKTLSGAAYGNANNAKGSSVAFQTADGMYWNIFGQAETNEYGVDNAETDSLIVFVDTNGEKKPNTLGLDVFVFVVNPDRGVLPAGSDNGATNCKDSESSGIDCAAKVIKNSKIDYDD